MSAEAVLIGSKDKTLPRLSLPKSFFVEVGQFSFRLGSWQIY